MPLLNTNIYFFFKKIMTLIQKFGVSRFPQKYEEAIEAANKHIRMISKGSHDIDDWSNGKFSFTITGINSISKLIQIEHCYLTFL